jgi:hypothetical protein
MAEVSSTPERRRYRRYAVDDAPLQVSWLDLSGKMRITRTRALNVCEEGMAVQLPEPVMPLLIRFQSDRFNINGAGRVRYCRRAGSRYVVGLEFTEGLHWRPPDFAVAEPIPVCDPESA